MAKVPGKEAALTEGDVAVILQGAVALGGDFPPGVPDTPKYRAMFERMKAEIAAHPERAAVDMPWNYAGD